MKTLSKFTTSAAIAFTALLFAGTYSAMAETEPNDTSGTANSVALPFTTNGTGGTVSGTLRAGNTTPVPRDQDWFKFKNLHHFDSIQVRIIPEGIDGAEAIDFSIHTAELGVLFSGSSSSQQNRTITAPRQEATFFVRIFDNNDLTSASGEGNYSVEIIGQGGISPAVAYLEHQKECKKIKKALKKAKKRGAAKKVKKLKKKLKACNKELDELEALL